MISILTSRSGDLWSLAAQRLKSSYESGREVVLLVPDQATLQAERDALQALQVAGFFRLQVLSPSRLSSYVFDRAGRDARSLIDERGQALTMARVLEDSQQQLAWYGSARAKPGFTQLLVQAIKELKGAGLSPQDVLDHVNAEGQDNPRLRDLALLYAAYEQALEGQLADREDREQEMLRRLEASTLFAGADLIVHGFDLFTPPLIRLITALCKRTASCLITLVTDRLTAPDGAAFMPVQQSLVYLTRALQEEGLAWEQQVVEAGPGSQPAALQHLQQQLLRPQQLPFASFPEGLFLYAAKTPHEEIRWVAQRIHAQLRRGDDPAGIAVYLAQDSYAALLPGVFSAYGLPHHLARKEPLLDQALVRCLLDALRCIQAAAWRPLDVFSYLKSPYSPLAPEMAWQLENYARAYGIRGRRWTQPFTRGKEEDLPALEALRLAAISPIDRLRQGLVQARSTAASIQAVLDFLSELGAQDRVLALEERYQQLGLMEEAQRACQVWDQLMGLFEQMEQLLGQQRVPLGRFAQWLEAGLSMSSLSALPPLKHSVQAGALGQLMLRRPHSVYILGLNAGALSAADEGLLGDKDREQLQEGLHTQLNLPLADKERMRLLDLWKAVAGAGSSLHLSYALSDDLGAALSPLMEIHRIKKLFPQLVEEGGPLAQLREPWPATPRVALEEAAALLATGQMSPPFLAAWDYLKKHPDWAAQAAGIQAALVGDAPDKRLAPGLADKLYPAGSMSVSRLETFAGCPFKHFVDYGLRPEERKEWAVQAVDLGSFCHAAMDGFSKKLQAEPDLAPQSREDSDRLMNQVLEGLTAGWEEAPWADTRRAQHRAQGVKDICRRMAWSLAENAAHSAFQTASSELNFGLGEGLPALAIQLTDGRVLRLRGTIDRLDTAVLDNQLQYLRIVDYKTGYAQLQGGELEAGVQLQLLLYLKAALSHMQGLLPAGAFYQRLADPLVKAQDEQKAQIEVRKKLRLAGIMLQEPLVVRGLDQGQPPLSLADYIKKDGSLVDSDSLLSHEQLNALMELAVRRAGELASQIFSGLISRTPLIRAGGRAECDYCMYQGICRLDKLSQEPLRRRSRKIKVKELAQELLASQEDS